MITLKNKDTGQRIGKLSEDELQYLIDELVEEHDEDKDYWLNKTQIEIMKEKGEHLSMLEMLEKELGDNQDMEIVWERS
jgi:hypothetical protein